MRFSDVVIKHSVIIWYLFHFVFVVDGSTFVPRDTKYGRVIGRVVEPLRGMQVEQYLGIPYAAPPVGALRFERPVSPHPWHGDYNAISYPPACPQMVDFHYINLHKPFFQRESEDCLYLNIYVPRNNHSNIKYPVLLYIHGGSNEVGMGAMFDGDVLAGVGEIIVVTFNYRLGAFGFLGAKKEGLEGNYGFLDQVAAMKWVKENIANFNGIHDHVTIDGHSAGAADVGFHLISPLTRGLFRYAIIQSGSPLAFWAMSLLDWEPGTNLDQKCRNIACPLGQTNTRLTYKEYLKTLPTEVIQTMPGKPTPGNLIKFPAVVDGYYLTDRPDNSLREGSFNGESFLMSFTKDEGSQHADVLLKLSKTFTESSFREAIRTYQMAFPDICGVADDLILYEYGGWDSHDTNNSMILKFSEMLSDLVFISPMIDMADIMSKSTDNLYVFSFAHESVYNKPSWQGVPHGRDLFYLFGSPLVGHPLYSYSPQDKLASRVLMKIWSNFVKTGKLKQTDKDKFSSYNAKTRPYVQLADDKGVVLKKRKHFKPRKMKFWNSFLPRIGQKRKCKASCRIGFLNSASNQIIGINLYQQIVLVTSITSALYIRVF